VRLPGVMDLSGEFYNNNNYNSNKNSNINSTLLSNICMQTTDLNYDKNHSRIKPSSSENSANLFSILSNNNNNTNSNNRYAELAKQLMSQISGSTDRSLPPQLLSAQPSLRTDGLSKMYAGKPRLSSAFTLLKREASSPPPSLIKQPYPHSFAAVHANTKSPLSLSASYPSHTSGTSSSNSVNKSGNMNSTVEEHKRSVENDDDESNENDEEIEVETNDDNNSNNRYKNNDKMQQWMLMVNKNNKSDISGNNINNNNRKEKSPNHNSELANNFQLGKYYFRQFHYYFYCCCICCKRVFYAYLCR
jgi:hypothetical protein